MKLHSRFLCLAALAACVFSSVAASENGWDAVPAILERIKAPVFPARDFVISDYGAKADGSDCTAAIRDAIAACNKAGGGRVVVPAGVWVTGAIHLKSGVNLHVSEGATLKFDPDPAKYLPVVFTRFEGTECMNYSPMIYAFEQENIAVTGKGILDGSANWDNWWGWVKRKGDIPAKASASVRLLLDMGERRVPVAERVFGEGHGLRPNFLQPYRCKNVLIEDITIHNSPMWEIHPVLCTNVTVRGVKVVSHGPNNDGCDPESSRDVLIENCLFDTGDDCIAIKSGKNEDGRRVAVASENIIIRGCTMKDGHGGVVIGSEISGDCRNVYVENCVMDSPELDRMLRFKSNLERGGVLENVFLRNVKVGRVAHSILTVDFIYSRNPPGKHVPHLRNVVVENVTGESSPRVLSVVGCEGSTVENITVKNSTFRGVEGDDVVQKAAPVKMINVKVERVAKKESK